MFVFLSKFVKGLSKSSFNIFVSILGNNGFDVLKDDDEGDDGGVKILSKLLPNTVSCKGDWGVEGISL